MSERHRSQLEGILPHEPNLDKLSIKIKSKETNYNLLNKIGNYEHTLIMTNKCIISRILMRSGTLYSLKISPQNAKIFVRRAVLV